MKKKFFAVLFAVVAALVLCFGLAACGEETPQTPSDTTETETGGGNNQGGGNNTPSDHVHAYGNWEVITPATHTATGTRRKYCSCGDHIDETIPKTTEHTFLPYSHTDATCTAAGEDVLRCECGKEQHTTIPAEGHTYEKGVCSVCGSVEGLIAFRTLEVSDDDTVYGKVSNQTETFSFIQEILFADGVTFTVSYDLGGTNTIPTKTVSLEIGDNTYYVLASRGNLLKLYTVTVRRRPVYNVSFETSGSAVSSQQVEEDQNIVQPAATAKTGYSFQNWTLNGNAVTFPYKAEEGIPQTSTYNVTLNAVFTANEYKATFDAKGGEVSGNEQTVTYDESYNFPVPTRTGYTFTGWYEGENQLTNVEGASLSAWTYAEGKQIDAHWSANNYLLTVEGNLSDAGTVTGGGTFAYDSDVTVTATTNRGYNFLGWYNEKDERVSEQESYTFPMGLEQTITAKWDFYTVTVLNSDTVAGSISQSYNKEKISAGEQVSITATTNLGYTFLGWYSGETELSTNETYSFTMKRENVDCEARWKVSPEMENFIFTSTSTTCTISGLKDNTVTEIVIPEYVTSIGNSAFKNCTMLESVIWNAEDCSTGGTSSIFSECTNLKTVTFGENVKILLDYAFENCSGLEHISVSEGNQTYRSEGDCLIETKSKKLLLGCKNSKIPDNVTSIGDSAFKGCSGLTSIEIPDSVTSIESYAFKGCSGLTSITIPFVGRSRKAASNTYQYPFGYIFGTSSFSGATAVKQWYYGSSTSSTTSSTYYIPNSLKSVTVTGGNILYGAFYNCSGLKSVTIGSGVTSIGGYAFYGCIGLQSVIWNAENCTTAGSSSSPIFKGCTNLKTVTFGENVKRIPSYAFYGCSGLTGELKIPDSVTTIGEYAFRNCSGLQSVTIGDNVTSIGEYAFYDCSGLQSVTIGDNVTSIGESAFRNCSGLQSVTIGSGVTEIGNYAFHGCSGLTGELKIPDGVTSIGYGAFNGCSGLESVTIGSDVASIGDYAFENCSGLESVTIGSGVTSIGSGAFEDCSGLTAVYYKGTSSAWDGIQFSSYDDYGAFLKKVTRYYYSDQTPSAEQWAESENWWHYEADGETIVLWTKEQE